MGIDIILQEGNAYSSFLLWQNLVFVQNLHNLELVVDLDFLDYVIKCAWLHVLNYKVYNLCLQHIENETNSHLQTKVHNKIKVDVNFF